MQSDHLKSLIDQAALLAGSARSEPAANLQQLLRSRLAQYYACSHRPEPAHPSDSLQDVQLETAREALHILEQVQLHLAGKHPLSSNAPAQQQQQQQDELLGTRDLAHIRTLLSLVFKWNTHPALQRICASIPTAAPGPRRKADVRIIDLTTIPDDYVHLQDTLLRLVHLILPTGLHGPPNATVLSSVILDTHLPDLLKPSLVLGWLPKSLASESVSPLNDLRPMVVRLMHMLPVSKCITALSAILADASSLPYVRRSCSYLMSRQLLRPHGIRGLLLALFPDDEPSEENAPLEKLGSVSKVLLTIPTGMTAPEFYDIVLPQLLSLMSSTAAVPSTQRRVAAFTLSRLLSPEENPHQPAVARVVLPALHKPFLQVTPQQNDADGQPAFSPAATLDILQTFLANTDPSPTLVSSIITPIVPALYTLSYSLHRVKSADPALAATLRGLLGTWGRLISDAEGSASLWLIVDGEGGEWRVDVAGHIRRVESAEADSPLSLFTPEDLRRAEESGELDLDANILDLRPDPAHFVAFLKTLDRPEIASDLFVRLLDAYRESKGARDQDPLRTLLYLQLIVQIQTQLSSGDSSVNILKKPDHILAFIKHALEASQRKTEKPSVAQSKTRTGLGLEDLRIVEDAEEAEGSEGVDSDDEDADADGDGNERSDGGGDDMTSTAVNLLLSVLEANPDLSTETAPILDEIFSLLDALARADTSTDSLKALAREARMVLIARLASSSSSSASKGPATKASSDGESPTETYQKALKLLQDPLLPVRAHGLLLLRQLVSPRRSTTTTTTDASVPAALLPGILSVFLQSLQDDDSYIFLNAVQGLAAMVDGSGREVLRGLVEVYVKGLDGVGAGAVTRQDVETRTRVGEAIGQVVRRCGAALPKYVDEIVPSLLVVMRAAHLPTALRTSALALLAQCTSTSPLAVLPWSTDLVAAMVDLLQLESVPAPQSVRTKPLPPPPPAPAPSAGENASSDLPVAPIPPKLDSSEFTPTTRDAKVPLLRRSALHLLALLTRAFAAQLDDSAGTAKAVYALPGELMRRARTTVGYVAATDEDGVVRVMAGESAEGLDALAEAMLDL